MGQLWYFQVFQLSPFPKSHSSFKLENRDKLVIYLFITHPYLYLIESLVLVLALVLEPEYLVLVPIFVICIIYKIFMT